MNSSIPNIKTAKDQILNALLIISSVFGFIAFTASTISKFINNNFTVSFVFELAVFGILIFVANRRTSFSIQFKSYILIFLIFLFTISDIAIYGLLSTARIYIVLIPLISIISFKISRTILIFASSLLIFMVLGILHYNRLLLIPESYNPALYFTKIYPWIINLIHMAILGTIVFIIGIKFFGSVEKLVEFLEEKNLQISENERNYRQIFNSTSEAIFIHDAGSGKILDVNDVMLKMYGYSSKDEVLKLAVGDLSKNDESFTEEQANQLLMNSLETGTQVFEWQAKRKNSELFWVEVSLQKAIINGEKRVLAVIRDISERKQMELTLKQSEERYKTLIETSQDGISLMDLNGIMLFVNSRKAHLVGAKSKEDLIGKSAFNLLPSNALEYIQSLMPTILAKGYMENIETEVQRFDGKSFSAEFNVTVLKDEAGNPQFLMDTMRDISERKLVEKALKESEERYRKLIESFPDIIMVTDLQGKILFGNEPLEKITGITLIDYDNQERTARIHPDDKPFVDEIINDLLASKMNHSKVFEHRFINASGNTLWFSGIIAKIRLNDQLVLQNIWRDITDKKNIEMQLDKYRDHLEILVKERTDELEATNEELSSSFEELNAQREELEATLENLKTAQLQLAHSEKMASLGILAAGVAHEINNPLNFIQGGVHGLENYFFDKDPKYLNDIVPIISGIQEGIDRASAIISSLSHYSRHDNMQLTRCELNSIVDHCLIILNNEIKQRILVEKNYSPEPCLIKGNEGKLHQAVMNILSNSVQAIENIGRIHISTKILKEKVILCIEDNGCGILPENLTKIFDPFYTTKQPGKGTGLGLSLTYNILNEHNATIEFASETGKGTKATIVFPIL